MTNARRKHWTGEETITVNDNRIEWCNPLRPLAVDVAVGAIIAVGLPDGGSIPARIEKIYVRPNGSVFGKFVAVPSGRRGSVRWDGHERVRLLPRHYGVCVECGCLAPCPRQDMEVLAARFAAESDPIAELELAFQKQEPQTPAT